jgi:predicted nucleotidyltransferase
MKSLSKTNLLQALERLGEIAEENETVIELCIYGGAAMMLAYDRRAITRDVDSLFHPRKQVEAWAAQVAREQGLPSDWLNDDVRQYIAPKESLRSLGLDLPGIRVTVPTASYLLAMKALAGRRALPGYEGDEADLRYLIKKMGIRSVEEIQEHIDQYFPDDVPSPEATALLKAIIRETWRDDR